MLVFDKHLPQDVKELFAAYSAAEIVEFLEELDLFLEGIEAKQEMGKQMNNQYALTFHLLKRAVRALEPVKLPLPNNN